MKTLKTSMLIFIISALAFTGCGNSQPVAETATEVAEVAEETVVLPLDTDQDGVPDTIDKDNETVK